MRSSSGCSREIHRAIRIQPGWPAAQVRHAYFQARRGNRVTLYADAHADHRTLQPIPLQGGRVYQPASCWDDIMGALMEAKHFIYITGAGRLRLSVEAWQHRAHDKTATAPATGWSVWTSLRLARDANTAADGPGVTLGQILLQKADEGVRVLILQCARHHYMDPDQLRRERSARPDIDSLRAVQGTTAQASAWLHCPASRPRRVLTTRLAGIATNHVSARPIA